MITLPIVAQELRITADAPERNARLAKSPALLVVRLHKPTEIPQDILGG
jgi:hypothetical protein